MLHFKSFPTRVVANYYVNPLPSVSRLIKIKTPLASLLIFRSENKLKLEKYISTISDRIKRLSPNKESITVNKFSPAWYSDKGKMNENEKKTQHLVKISPKKPSIFPFFFSPRVWEAHKGRVEKSRIDSLVFPHAPLASPRPIGCGLRVSPYEIFFFPPSKGRKIVHVRALFFSCSCVLTHKSKARAP